MKEEWMTMVDYPEYLISNIGNVFSKKSNSILSLRLDKKGYVRVTLGYPKRKPVLVHRLVAIAFIPNPNNYPQINHKDTNKQNNYFENLEWCTNKMNSDHAWAHNLQTPFKGSEIGTSILTEEDVLQIRQKSKEGHTRKMLADQYGVSPATIKDIKLRRSWAHI